MESAEWEASLTEPVTKKGSRLSELEAALHKTILCAEAAQSSGPQQGLDSEFNRVDQGVYTISNWANTQAFPLILMDGKGCSVPPLMNDCGTTTFVLWLAAILKLVITRVFLTRKSNALVSWLKATVPAT